MKISYLILDAIGIAAFVIIFGLLLLQTRFAGIIGPPSCSDQKEKLVEIASRAQEERALFEAEKNMAVDEAEYWFNRYWQVNQELERCVNEWDKLAGKKAKIKKKGVKKDGRN